MNLTENKILETLSNVIHPEKKKNIVELGLVEKIEINGKQVKMALVFNTSNDPFANSIRKACLHAIKNQFGENVEIEGNIEVIMKEKPQKKEEQLLKGVKNIIAVASGKGGVGKSTVSVNLAIALSKAGKKVGLIDADIYGPSIPIMFGLENQKPEAKEIDGKMKVIPFEKYGVKLLSIGFFVDTKQALIWRGPMASNALKQLFSEADWGELDYLIIDLPPGTGDIHLTLVQNIPVTGAVVVSTPQKVALADARKAVSMFAQPNINVPVIGFVENMAWFTPAELPENKYYIFGKQGVENLASELDVELLGQIPIVQSICESGDSGNPIVTSNNSLINESFNLCAEKVISQINKRNAEKLMSQKVEIDENEQGCEH